MKRLFFYSLLILTSVLIIIIFTLSTIGIETNKFNRLIINKASQTKNINLDLDTIKFKIDPKELSLFLETQNPKIIYSEIPIPVNNIKVYIDFISLLKSNLKVIKISIFLKELEINQLSKFSKIMKPSNFKSILNNKIKGGKLKAEIELFLNNEGSFKNFIAKGSVQNLSAEIMDGMNLKKTELNFFADRNDILLKKINGNIEDIEIFDGDIQLNLENGAKINSNFNSKINFNKELINKYSKYFETNFFLKNIDNITGNLNNNFSIKLDKTNKLIKYNYDVSGNIEKCKFTFFKPFKSNLFEEKIEKIDFSNLELKASFSPNNSKISGNGKYSFNNSEFFAINFSNNLINDSVQLKLNLDIGNIIKLDFINYKKQPKSVAKLDVDLEKKKNILKINSLKFNESKNSIKIDGLILNKKKFLSFKKVEIVTTNNNFYIEKKRKIIIKGNKFDATNLAKIFNESKGENIFNKIDSEIEIEFKNIKVPMSEDLQNFKLIGEVQKGQFVKITSKGEFGGNNFLDISMKREKNSNKKYLEIYSDLTRPLLTEYSFFNGLSGGKLLFNSIIDGPSSNSKLKIENFKVINAPGVIKLLSLADLGGLVDLAEGEGLSFDLLSIDMEKNQNTLKLNEILALGPSMSVLMEGYQEASGLTSLRGTLVPAKTLNKMISKIPVIGNIVIPKEVGEGLFGISFKMKGPKDNIKTTINPIRTLTPRFIQKIIDKNKEIK